jgi:cytochrome c6
MKLVLGAMIMLGLLLGTTRPAAAQDATQTLYKTKCQICHGADATGSPVGKKLGVKDFQSAEVQKQPDSELLEIAQKGKGKMPAYEAKLANNQLTDLIKLMRELAKEGGKGK